MSAFLSHRISQHTRIDSQRTYEGHSFTFLTTGLTELDFEIIVEPLCWKLICRLTLSVLKLTPNEHRGVIADLGLTQ